MTTTFIRSPLVFLVLAGALALATPSMAEMVNFKADLKAASEVPPNDSKGSGSMTATYDTVSNQHPLSKRIAELASHSREPAIVDRSGSGVTGKSPSASYGDCVGVIGKPIQSVLLGSQSNMASAPMTTLL